MEKPQVGDITDPNDPLLRQAEEHYELPVHYEDGVGWVDRNGKPIKTRKWSEVRRQTQR